MQISGRAWQDVGCCIFSSWHLDFFSFLFFPSFLISAPFQIFGRQLFWLHWIWLFLTCVIDRLWFVEYSLWWVSFSPLILLVWTDDWPCCQSLICRVFLQSWSKSCERNLGSHSGLPCFWRMHIWLWRKAWEDLQPLCSGSRMGNLSHHNLHFQALPNPATNIRPLPPDSACPFFTSPRSPISDSVQTQCPLPSTSVCSAQFDLFHPYFSLK